MDGAVYRVLMNLHGGHFKIGSGTISHMESVPIALSRQVQGGNHRLSHVTGIHLSGGQSRCGGRLSGTLEDLQTAEYWCVRLLSQRLADGGIWCLVSEGTAAFAWRDCHGRWGRQLLWRFGPLRLRPGRLSSGTAAGARLLQGYECPKPAGLPNILPGNDGEVPALLADRRHTGYRVELGGVHPFATRQAGREMPSLMFGQEWPTAFFFGHEVKQADEAHDVIVRFFDRHLGK